MFLRLLFESFRRQRRRKLLAGVAILLGTTAVTAMLALATTIGDRIHAELAVYGANIVVTPAAQNLAVNIGGTDIRPTLGDTYLHESDLDKLRTIFWANNITGVSPELNFSVSESSIAAVDPHPSVTLPAFGFWFHHPMGSGAGSTVTGAPQLHGLWRIRGRWPEQYTGKEPCAGVCPAGEVVVGRLLAEKQHLALNSVLAIKPSTSKTADAALFRVVGIASTDGPSDRALIFTLQDAQALSGQPDAISRIEVSARTKPEDAFARRDPDTLSPADRDRWYCRPYANSIAYQIREAIPSADAQQVRRVEQSEGNVLRRISGLMWLIAAAALVAAGFAVAAAIATSVLERRAEIGLMRSLGAGVGRIALLFYTEAALLALAAGSAGYLVGSGLAALLGAHIFGESGNPGGAASHLATIFNPVLIPITLGLALLVAIAGSTPAIRSALRLDPSAILRNGA